MADPARMPPQKHRPPASLSRRGFLRLAAGIGITVWAGRRALDALEAGGVVRQAQKLMGTVVNLNVIAPDRETAARAEAAIAACLGRMAALEALLSRFKADSQVAELNRTGCVPHAHPALLDLVQQARQVSELSAGLFDITILPVLALYQRYQAQGGGLPPPAELEAACCKVDYRKLAVAGGRVSLAEPGMGITLDGIAKGYIVDEGVSRLRDFGFTDVLVEAGGDLAAGGQPEFDRPWRVGIQPPRPGSARAAARIDLRDEAAATSGDSLQSFTPDYSQHHILNPKTGRSSPALASATVIAPRLAQADALATTLMLMEAQLGLEMVRGLGLRAVLVTKDMRVLRV